MKNKFLNKINDTLLYRITFLLSIAGVFILVLDLGFNQTLRTQQCINLFYFAILILGILTTLLRYLKRSKTLSKRVILFDIISITTILFVISVHFFTDKFQNDFTAFYDDLWIKLATILTFIREFSEKRLNYKRSVLNPAQLFIVSFLLLIAVGTLLLMLPNATSTSITFIDALFTATSAVCVTGLIVVDTGSFFTEFGQVIILVLIQIGGLGMLTFASYFSYFFKGGSTYENQLVLSDMTNSRKMSEVYTTIVRILSTTFVIELLGAIAIYTSIDSMLFKSFIEKIYFSVFHSISSFCNAGFSTLSNSLHQEGYQYNYSLHLIILIIYVLGGLGFPIVANIVKYLKINFFNGLIRNKKRILYKPWILNINSRITLVTTTVLIVLGTFLFYVFENDNVLTQQKDFFGKFITALFGATTPRTAGFNTIDMSLLQTPTVLLVILLMWIGASPASTGGGIKTSTFTIAILNFFSLARGKNKIEIYRREIAEISIHRAFAVITLSLVVIGTGIIIISFAQPNIPLLNIAFECFSAYSTVGLSLGITDSLNSLSKLTIIVIMFIGRVSMLSLLIAIIKKSRHKNYRYPAEEISIN
ncbi:TrkH family potassium uptake protein [Wenyingzhuangia sp. IMCC45533]